MEAVDRLSRAFLGEHPQDAARLLESFTSQDIADTLAECTTETAARVLRRMVPPRAADCLSALPNERAAAFAAEMPIASAAPVLRRMEPDLQDRLLSGMPDRHAQMLRSLLRYPEGTAGAAMDPRAFTLPDDITVAEARRRVQKAGRQVRYYLYVVDRGRRLVGVLNLRDFMLAAPSALIGSLMNPQVARVPATAVVADILRDPNLRRFLSLPVVDKRGAFLGVLGHKALGAAAQQPGGRPEHAAVSTLLAMGELYWAGLAGVVGGLLQGRDQPGPRNDTFTGGSDEG